MKPQRQSTLRRLIDAAEKKERKRKGQKEERKRKGGESLLQGGERTDGWMDG